jgi:quercetin dioxygenase-like cupin family protein
MRKTVFLGVVAALALVGTRGAGQHEKEGDAMGVAFFTPGQIKWGEAPAVLPRGAKVAVLDGDPTKKGPFVMRVWMPDGYRVPPHTHPERERVTVISGTFYIGMGDTFDMKKGREMSPGTFGSWPAGMKHFGWAKGETVIQINATGPWSLKYVNPDDDPRNGKK